MKNLFDKYRQRLSPGEKESIWQDIVEPRDLEGERRTQFWRAFGITAASVAAVALAVLFWDFGPEGGDRFERLAMNENEPRRERPGDPVTLQLERTPGASLLPGMTASVSWFTGNGVRDGAVVVPLASLVTDEAGETFVWRVDPATMRIERAPVTTGELVDGGLEVLSGLEPGNRILAAGVHFVTDGQLIRPMQG